MYDKPPCNKCEMVHEKEKELPPCDACRVELFDENIEVAEVYWLCKNQLRFDKVGNVVDLDFTAVKAVLDLYEIEDKLDVFSRVVKLFYYCMENLLIE